MKSWKFCASPWCSILTVDLNFWSYIVYGDVLAHALVQLRLCDKYSRFPLHSTLEKDTDIGYSMYGI